ncbi:hypothetical protein [Streptomyces sp. NPDC092307]|uniref:hypothetical protein n=1 Tax=Streptomyces sp. NPDC092307 TaxID=3366013 RepID=UPI0037F99B38
MTNTYGADPEVFDWSFTAYVRAFAERLRNVDPHRGIHPGALEYLGPEDLDELAEPGEIGPVEPGFGPF